MFDLDRAIVQWCKRAYPRPHYRKSQVTELEDHLHCSVAGMMEQGISQEEAFRRATSQLGESELLRDEYRKNWSWLTSNLRRIECLALHWRKAMNPVGRARQPAFRFSTALLVAGIAFAAIAFIRDTEAAQWTQSMLIALYTLPFMLFGAAV